MRTGVLRETYVIEEIYPTGNTDMHVSFRIEIFETVQMKENFYYPMVWMKEDYDVQPNCNGQGISCPKPEICTAMISTQEGSLGWDEITGSSSNEVFEKVVLRIKKLCEFDREV